MHERAEKVRAEHEAALFDCIGSGDIDGLLRLILSEGADPNARDASSGKCALEVAALARNADVVEALCENGASLAIARLEAEEMGAEKEESSSSEAPAARQASTTTSDSAAAAAPVEQSRVIVELVANVPAKVDQKVRGTRALLAYCMGKPFFPSAAE